MGRRRTIMTSRLPWWSSGPWTSSQQSSPCVTLHLFKEQSRCVWFINIQNRTHFVYSVGVGPEPVATQGTGPLHFNSQRTGSPTLCWSRTKNPLHQGLVIVTKDVLKSMTTFFKNQRRKPALTGSTKLQLIRFGPFHLLAVFFRLLWCKTVFNWCKLLLIRIRCMLSWLFKVIQKTWMLCLMWHYHVNLHLSWPCEQHLGFKCWFLVKGGQYSVWAYFLPAKMWLHHHFNVSKLQCGPKVLTHHLMSSTNNSIPQSSVVSLSQRRQKNIWCAGIVFRLLLSCYRAQCLLDQADVRCSGPALSVSLQGWFYCPGGEHIISLSRLLSISVSDLELSLHLVSLFSFDHIYCLVSEIWFQHWKPAAVTWTVRLLISGRIV